MTTHNPYNNEGDGLYSPAKAVGWEMGYAAGYEDNEEAWVKRVLPIVGELEDYIRYDWEHNDCVEVDKLKLIFDAFFQFPTEHDWLFNLIFEAVHAQNSGGWELSKGERLDFEVMARAFNLVLTDAA